MVAFIVSQNIFSRVWNRVLDLKWMNENVVKTPFFFVLVLLIVIDVWRRLK